ncbi:MAG: aminotransferase class V-fold PLP-dependent enzyme, partial [bacterium]
YTGAKEAVSTQSGTAALHIALHELGVGPGDEVIVPVSTFIATVNPVKYVGAKPVFVDVNSHTWNIDTSKIEKALTKKTKAIMPVHLYGNPCYMDEIMCIAKSNNLFVIEDATQSLGATYNGTYTGTFGDFGCFSFNGNKTITTGGGGMVVGTVEKRLNHIKFLVNQAREESKGYYHPEIGFNYRMTNLEAALGLAQIGRLEEFVSKKRRFNRIYREELGKLDYIKFQEEYPGAESSFWLSCILIDVDREIEDIKNALRTKGIPTRRIFIPIVEFPPYKRYKHTDYKNSYHIYNMGLCLPSSVLNSEDDIYGVCKILREVI